MKAATLSLGYDREIFDNQDAHEALKYMFLTGEMQALIAGTVFLRDDLLGCLPEALFRVSEDYVIVSRVLAGNPNLRSQRHRFHGIYKKSVRQHTEQEDK
jgi:hypothetical protein